MSESIPADDLGLRGADAAMQRVAEEVRRVAAIAGTPIAIWKDGRVVLEQVTSPYDGLPAQSPASRP